MRPLLGATLCIAVWLVACGSERTSSSTQATIPTAPSGTPTTPSTPSTPSTGSGTTPPTTTGALSLAASKWTTISTPSNFPLTTDTAGHLSFTFPLAPNEMNYLYTPVKGPISNQITVSMSVVTAGSPVFNYQTESFNTCAAPAHARPFIWAHNDSFADNDRWWSNQTAYELSGAGSTTLTIPLTPDRWSNVPGQLGSANPTAFAAALASVSSVGLTFGGGCFYGHGINVKGGTAVFSINEYVVQ